MRLFTFLVEKEGGTCSSQQAGKDLGEASCAFLDTAYACEYVNSNSEVGHDLLRDLSEAVPLTGLVNAYCGSPIDKHMQHWLINIIETVASSEG